MKKKDNIGDKFIEFCESLGIKFIDIKKKK